MAGNKSLGEQFLELKEELKQEREARAAAEAARDAAEEAWAAEQQQQQATRDTEQRAREAARDAAQRAREEARDAEHKEQFSLLMQKLSRVGLGRGSGTPRNRDEEAREASVASGNRSEVPVEVGPREDQSSESGQDRDSGLNGESASFHAGVERRGRNNTLASIKVPIPRLKDRSKFTGFHTKCEVYAKYYGFDRVFSSEEPYLDVGVPGKSKEDFVRRGVLPETYEMHLKAWVFLSEALTLPVDIGRFKRGSSPGEVWAQTVKHYRPRTTGSAILLNAKFKNFKVPRGEPPIEHLLQLEDLVEEMEIAELPTSEQATLGTFVAALPIPEYESDIRDLSRQKKFVREDVINAVQTTWDFLQRTQPKKKSGGAHALVTDGRGGAGGRGNRGGRRGGRGGGRGSSSKWASKKSSDGSNGAGDSKPSDKTPICYNCHLPGHFQKDCTVTVCKKCRGAGHTEAQCPSTKESMQANLVVELPGPGDNASTTSSEGMDGFVARELPSTGCVHLQGKCDDFGSGLTNGVGGLALRAGLKGNEKWYLDTAASGHMTPSSAAMTSFQPCNSHINAAGGENHAIIGRGTLKLNLSSTKGSMPTTLHNVAVTPSLRYNLICGAAIVADGHKIEVDTPGLTLRCKSTGVEMLCPPEGNMYIARASRVGPTDVACAVIAPGLTSTVDVDPNHYHRTAGHPHSRLMRKSAEQQGVTLKRGVKLQPCVGCSAAKGLSAPVNKTTTTRVDRKNGRIFVDTSGKNSVLSIGGRQYGIIYRDDATRMTRMYHVKDKSEAPDTLERYIQDTNEMGPPRIIRSDDAPELQYGKFAEICRKHGIKREFTSAGTPQLNGVAERGLTLVQKLAKACMYQAQVSFVGMGLPDLKPFWAEAENYSVDVHNRTATSSNKDYKSPYEMWYRKAPPPTVLQWFQPCFFKSKRKNKSDMQAKEGFLLGPALDHPHDTYRVLDKVTRKVHITRDVTWRHVPTPAPLSAQLQTLPAPAEGGEDDVIAVEGREGAPLQGGGGDDAPDSDDDASDSDDDDLEVTMESDLPKVARDGDVAAGANPGTTASIGTPSLGGGGPSSPSTVVSRNGSFGGVESIPPDSNISSSSSSSSTRSGSSSESNYMYLEDRELCDQHVLEHRVRPVVLPLRGPYRHLLVEEVHHLDLQRQQEARHVRT